MLEFETRYGKLPNGVRTLEIRAPQREITAVAVHVKTGSRNDSAHKRGGISHTTEHFVFKGTQKMTEREMAVKVDKLGANHSAHTEKEQTVFYMETAYENAPKSINILGEVVARPTFPQQQIKLESGILVSEISDYRDDPRSIVQELFESLLFGESDMAEPILGTIRSVKTSSRRDVRKYHEKWYKGGNILVVLAGKTRGLARHVRKSFGNIPKGPVEGYHGSAGYGRPGTVVSYDNTEQAHFVIGVPGSSMADQDFYASKIIEAVLGGHSVTDLDISIQSSRLYDKLRVERGVTYEVSGTQYSGSDAGYVAVQGMVRPHLLNSTLNIVKDQVFNLADTITREEVERAKEFWKFYYLKKVESTLDIALLMGQPALMMNIVEQPKDIIEKIQSVGLREVKKVAKAILKEEEMRLAVLGPFDEKLRRVRNGR